jgi:hypothetical protein
LSARRQTGNHLFWKGLFCMKNLTSVDFRTHGKSYCVEYHPQLVEEAVLRLIRGHPKEDLFRKERNRIYEFTHSEEREEAFQQLHERWFNHLNLGEPVQQVFKLWPILITSTHRCLFIKARSTKEMGADLYLARVKRDRPELSRRDRVIVVQLTPELLCQSPQFLTFLQREMLHVVDMLDPHFGYEPDFPKGPLGPSHRVFQERYKILWDITVDGRLYKKGWLPFSVRETHKMLFSRTFPSLQGEKLESLFSYFFDHAPHTHQELLSFAQNPEKWLAGTTDIERGFKSIPSSKGWCALCRFPSFQLINAVDLSIDLLAQIQQEHPTWNPQEPICWQCKDLYETRFNMGKVKG